VFGFKERVCAVRGKEFVGGAGGGGLNCVSRFYNLQVNTESILHPKQQ